MNQDQLSRIYKAIQRRNFMDVVHCFWSLCAKYNKPAVEASMLIERLPGTAMENYADKKTMAKLVLPCCVEANFPDVINGVFNGNKYVMLDTNKLIAHAKNLAKKECAVLFPKLTEFVGNGVIRKFRFSYTEILCEFTEKKFFVLLKANYVNTKSKNGADSLRWNITLYVNDCYVTHAEYRKLIKESKNAS